MDFNAFAKTPKKGKTIVVHADYIPFLTELAKSVRFDYTANTKLCFKLNMVSEAASTVTNAGTPYLRVLPPVVQHSCCKKNGSYSDDARSKWANPGADLSGLPVDVVQGANILGAYDQWKAAQIAE